MDNVMKTPASQDCPAEAAGTAEQQQSSANESTALLRIRRIEDLQAEALANPDALQATLGAANGALMRMGFRLEEAIEGTLANIADPVARFERLAPAIDSYLKVMRQVDRFAQLDQRLASVRQAGIAPKPR